MMALYESEESESLNETLVAQGVARVASNADKLATSQVCILVIAAVFCMSHKRTRGVCVLYSTA